MDDFDWDDGNRGHIARHGVTPEEAEQVYLNDPIEEGWSEEDGEVRLSYIGETNEGRILDLVITMREELVRVVTCFDVPRSVRLSYIRSKVI
jgi:uncharacterized DUF497 family protein